MLFDISPEPVVIFTAGIAAEFLEKGVKKVMALQGSSRKAWVEF